MTSVLSVCLSVWGAGVSAQPLPVRVPAPMPPAACVPGEYLVGLTAAADNATGAKLVSAYGTTLHHFAQHHVYHLKFKPGTDTQKRIAQLQKMTGVEYVEPNRVYHKTDDPAPVAVQSNDPAIINGEGVQWGPIRTATNVAWSIWRPKNVKPIVIAIVDTGVDDTHPDLTNMMLRDSNGTVIGYNSLTDTTGPTPPDNPHGTHVAGIAAAQTNNDVGIAGIAGWTGDTAVSDTTHIKIMPVKVLDWSGSGTTTTVIDGINWAVANGANVINLSLGQSSPDTTLRKAIQNAWNNNCVVVAAAGNSGDTTPFYPAAYIGITISVAGTSNNTSDSLASWSTRGWWVTVSAPGDTIYSTFPYNQYAYDSGTSMASPHVAGLAALIFAQNPLLRNSEVVNYITSTVDKYPSTADPIAANSGRINSSSALQAVNKDMATVSGQVNLSGCLNINQTVTMEFRSSDKSLDFTYPVTLTSLAPGSSVGTFSISGVPYTTLQGTVKTPNVSYTVAVQGSNWLRDTVPLNAPLTAAPTFSVLLNGGDADGNNIVDSEDFNLLINAYNGELLNPGSGYDPQMDFNNDGVIDTLDFSILVGSFGMVGAN